MVQDLSKFDRLNCPACGHLTPPARENSDGSVTYKCVSENWCEMTSWRISKDGDITHEKYEGNE